MCTKIELAFMRNIYREGKHVRKREKEGDRGFNVIVPANKAAIVISRTKNNMLQGEGYTMAYFVSWGTQRFNGKLPSK